MPKATRVELPLMGKDEAVALLLDLAHIKQEEYLSTRKSYGGEGLSWPPQAARDIAVECGLLPFMLTIAAKVVRSWGTGWGK